MANGPKGSKRLILALIKTTYILLLIRVVLKMDELRKSTTLVSSKSKLCNCWRTLEEEDAKGVSSASWWSWKLWRSILSSRTEPIIKRSSKARVGSGQNMLWRRLEEKRLDSTQTETRGVSLLGWLRFRDILPSYLALDGRQLCDGKSPVTSHTCYANLPRNLSPFSLNHHQITKYYS